jgi:molybdate transport system substrate-binding protein
MRLMLLFLLQSILIPAYASDIKLAAATNLRFVLPELIGQFEQHYPQHKVNTSFAASGTLTSQIQHGAPFDVFLSASPEYIIRLQQTDFIKGNIVNFCRAQLALFSRNDSGIILTKNLSGLKTALDNNSLNKLVIANPNHAPYGQLAKKELELHGLWDDVQPHLLIAESASQALQFSLSPQTSAGFIPYSYVLQDKIAKRGNGIKLNVILQQQAVMIKGGDSAASLFLVFLESEQAKVIFLKHGFEVVN